MAGYKGQACMRVHCKIISMLLCWKFFTIKYLGNMLVQKVREIICSWKREDREEKGLFERINESHSCLLRLPCTRIDRRCIRQEKVTPH